MKITLKITLLLAVITFAAVACLAIFEVMTHAEAKEFLLKSEAVIFLLGSSAALLSLLLNKGKSAA